MSLYKILNKRYPYLINEPNINRLTTYNVIAAEQQLTKFLTSFAHGLKTTIKKKIE